MYYMALMLEEVQIQLNPLLDYIAHNQCIGNNYTSQWVVPEIKLTVSILSDGIPYLPLKLFIFGTTLIY
jgi:hypothetical protein